MSLLLERMLGRLPVGRLKLTHQRRRFIAAIAGVAYANLLVFFQLGFLGALGTSSTLPYRVMQADILISGANARTLTDGTNVARQRMLEALPVPGVAAATPLFVGALPLNGVSTTDLNRTIFGVAPSALGRFCAADIAAGAERDSLADVVLITQIEGGNPVPFEAGTHKPALAGTFATGAGFEADGYAVVSDQTFLRMFPDRSAPAPTHIMVALEPGADPVQVAQALRDRFPPEEAQVRSLTEAKMTERNFQTAERPVGVIFDFGAIMGVMVGLVIVYQVLSTEVADHLREYPTLKAIGYKGGYFVGIVAEQAVVLGLAGFIPGYVISSLVYGALAGTTGLPIEMTQGSAITVVVGTLIACLVSGPLAARKLASADPADLY